MEKIEELDSESCEIAKIELAKQFGELVKLLSNKEKKLFIR